MDGMRKLRARVFEPWARRVFLTLLADDTITVLTVFVSYLTFRFPRTRPLLDGEPILLVHDGHVIRANARRERITEEELRAVARQQQLASLDDVRHAVLETNGKISMIPKTG